MNYYNKIFKTKINLRIKKHTIMSKIFLAFFSALILSSNSLNFNCKTELDYNLYDYSELASSDDYIIDNF